MNLTKKAIDAFTHKGGWDVRWDDDVKGLGLRIYPSGRKSFIFRYTSRSQKKKTITIGPYGAFTLHKAREIAQRMRVEVSQGHDPLAAKQSERDAPPVTDLAERYLTEHAEAKKKPKSVQLDRANLKNYILPQLGSIKVGEVTRDDVSKLHHKMRDTPYQANRVLSLISKMFNLAEKWGLRPDFTNPCRHIEKYEEKKADRYLSKEELSRLAAVLNEAKASRTEPPSVITAIRLLILTGARLNEILTAKWEYLDYEHSCLRLPDSKTGAKVIYLPPLAIEVLRDTERLAGNPHVITGRKPGSHLVNLHKAWHRILKLAELEDVRLHDLRHSFASIAAGQGISLTMIGALLGHSQPQTTARYAHLASDPLKEASTAIGQQISDAMKSGET
jgi:integrase